MSEVVVRFVAEDSFVSSAIRKFTGSLFSHVEFGTPTGTWIGAHLGGGVQERAADYSHPTREYVYAIPCSGARQSELLLWARSKIGTIYNTKDILGLALSIRRMRNPHAFICSQFVTEGLIETFGAYQVLNVLPSWAYRITPEELHLSPIFVGHLRSRHG